MLLSSLAKFSEAEDPLKKSLAIYEEIEQSGLKVAHTLDNLATLYYRQGRFEESEKQARRSLEIRKGRFGPQHPQVIEALTNVGVMLYSQKNYKDAEQTLKLALANAIQGLGSFHPFHGSVLTNLAAAELALGKKEQAISHLREALMQKEANFGPTHPSTLISLQGLGATLKLSNKIAEAELVCETVVQRCSKIYGPNHPSTADARLNFGQLHLEKADFAGAIMYLSLAFESYLNCVSRTHVNTVRTAISLAKAYNRSGKHAEAVALYKEFFKSYDEGTENQNNARQYFEESLSSIQNQHV